MPVYFLTTQKGAPASGQRVVRETSGIAGNSKLASLLGVSPLVMKIRQINYRSLRHKFIAFVLANKFLRPIAIFVCILFIILTVLNLFFLTAEEGIAWMIGATIASVLGGYVFRKKRTA